MIDHIPVTGIQYNAIYQYLICWSSMCVSLQVLDTFYLLVFWQNDNYTDICSKPGVLICLESGYWTHACLLKSNVCVITDTGHLWNTRVLIEWESHRHLQQLRPWIINNFYNQIRGPTQMIVKYMSKHNVGHAILAGTKAVFTQAWWGAVMS